LFAITLAARAAGLVANPPATLARYQKVPGIKDAAVLIHLEALGWLQARLRLPPGFDIA
jgi:hypothetical protein